MCSLLNELRCAGAVRSFVERIGLRPANMTANCLLCKLLGERGLAVSLARFKVPYTHQCSVWRRGALQIFAANRRVATGVLSVSDRSSAYLWTPVQLEAMHVVGSMSRGIIYMIQLVKCIPAAVAPCNVTMFLVLASFLACAHATLHVLTSRCTTHARARYYALFFQACSGYDWLEWSNLPSASDASERVL
jgi:hypothetical protein